MVFAVSPTTGGALLVAEMLLDEGGTSPPEVLLQSLNMLSQTHGRERRLSEYATLLQSVGFAQVEGKKTGVCGWVGDGEATAATLIEAALTPALTAHSRLLASMNCCPAGTYLDAVIAYKTAAGPQGS